jgi:hypothetical protein
MENNVNAQINNFLFMIGSFQLLGRYNKGGNTQV